MKPSLLHDIIIDARTNYNKTFRDLVWGHNVSGKEEKLKEIIYDARQNREFDYISAAEQNRILERKIIVVGELQHIDPKLKRSGFIAYDGENTLLVGFKGKKTLESGYVYSPYIPRTFPKLIAEDLVSVQPMSRSCSVAWSFDFETPELKSPPIVANPRKLQCALEVEQMVKEYGGFSNEKYITDMNEKYLTDMIAEKMRLDIDREILHRQTVPLMPLTLTTGSMVS